MQQEQIFGLQLKGLDNLTVLGCAQTWSSPFCITTVILAVLSYLTLILGLYCTVRLARLVRNFFCVQMIIQLGTLVYVLIIAIYFTIYDHFLLFMTYEFLKITTLFALVSFFAFSILRFKICPNFITPLVMRIGFCVLYIPTIITYACAIYLWSKREPLCSNTARFAFAIFEVVVCLIFGLTSFVTLRRVVKKVAVSSNYMVRHTRPMVTINLIYLWMSIANLAMRIFFHVTSDHTQKTCRQELIGFPDWVAYTYGIYLWVELIAPPLAIYWYFYKTVHENKQVDVFGIDDPNFPRWSIQSSPSSVSLNITSGNGKYMDYRIENLSNYTDVPLDETMESANTSDYEYDFN